jgi:hypothetical protein
MPRGFPLQDSGPGMNELFHDLQIEQELERAARRNRKLSDPGDVPTPPEGVEGLPIPASQDPLRRLY